MSNSYNRDATGEELASLAQHINELHGKAEAGLKHSLAYAIDTGLALIEAQQNRVPSGTWLAWVVENLTFCVRTAQHYMRLANHWREAGGNAKRISHFGLVEALEFISDSSEAADGFDDLTPAEQAQLIAEEEKEALAGSEERQGRRAAEDEERKFARKIVTLKNIARFLRKVGREHMAELIEQALAEEEAAELAEGVAAG